MLIYAMNYSPVLPNLRVHLILVILLLLRLLCTLLLALSSEDLLGGLLLTREQMELPGLLHQLIPLQSVLWPLLGRVLLSEDKVDVLLGLEGETAGGFREAHVGVSGEELEFEGHDSGGLREVAELDLPDVIVLEDSFEGGVYWVNFLDLLFLVLGGEFPQE